METLWILLLILNIRESLMLTFENKTKATNAGSGNSTSKRYKSWACWARNWFRMKWKWVCYITGCNNTLKSEKFFSFFTTFKNLCRNCACHSVESKATGERNLYGNNTRTPLLDDACQHRNLRILCRLIFHDEWTTERSNECRWHVGMSQLIFLSPFM